MQTIPGAGTSGSRLYNLASGNLNIYYGDGTLEALRTALIQAIPPITFVNTKHFPHWQLETAHAVVVIAINDHHVMVNDPGVSQAQTLVTLGDFLLAWDEMANLYALIQRR